MVSAKVLFVTNSQKADDKLSILFIMLPLRLHPDSCFNHLILTQIPKRFATGRYGNRTRIDRTVNVFPVRYQPTTDNRQFCPIPGFPDNLGHNTRQNLERVGPCLQNQIDPGIKRPRVKYKDSLNRKQPQALGLLNKVASSRNNPIRLKNLIKILQKNGVFAETLHKVNIHIDLLVRLMNLIDRALQIKNISRQQKNRFTLRLDRRI